VKRAFPITSTPVCVALRREKVHQTALSLTNSLIFQSFPPRLLLCKLSFSFQDKTKDAP